MKKNKGFLLLEVIVAILLSLILWVNMRRFFIASGKISENSRKTTLSTSDLESAALKIKTLFDSAYDVGNICDISGNITDINMQDTDILCIELKKIRDNKISYAPAGYSKIRPVYSDGRAYIRIRPDTPKKSINFYDNKNIDYRYSTSRIMHGTERFYEIALGVEKMSIKRLDDRSFQISLFGEKNTRYDFVVSCGG